jgi:hypothetical protein
MKTIEQAKNKLEAARAKAKEARRQYDKLISAEKRGRLARAKKKAKFRIGDIIRYRPDIAPILVIAIECYDSGEPTYRGLQVCGGKLTRNIRSTQGWGTQAPYVGGDGKRYPENDWQKVGDCTELRANRHNQPPPSPERKRDASHDAGAL